MNITHSNIQHSYKSCLCYAFTRCNFCQIKSFIRFHLAFVFGLQTFYLIDSSKIYKLKGLDSGAQK